MILRAALFAALAAAPALANDSEAGLSAGGLVVELRQNDRIEMQAEDLRISPDLVSVDYTFFNHGAQDATITIAFPMPEVAVEPGFNIAYYQGWEEDADALSFTVLADGQPVATTAQRRAFMGDQDVTDRILAAGLPLNPLAAAAALAADSPRAAALGPLYAEDAPAWVLRTVHHWPQTFPAGRVLRLTQSYRPISGGAIIGADDIDPADPYWAQYCPDPDFLTAARTLMRRTSGDQEFPYGLTRSVDYILTTGANWRGPIGDFRLTVEKPSAEALVSFCATRVTKTSPTTFEVRHKDFTPTEDLHILWVVPPGG